MVCRRQRQMCIRDRNSFRHVPSFEPISTTRESFDKLHFSFAHNACQKVIDLSDKSPPEIIYSVAKKSNFIISNDTGPGHIAALSKSPILFLAKDNVISKSNVSEYKNAYTILADTMDSISVKTVLDFLHDSKLINK